MARPAVHVVVGKPLVGGRSDVLAVPFSPGPDGPVPGPGFTAAGKALGVDLLALAVRDKAKGDAGEIVAIPLMGAGTAEQILLVGTGDGSPTALRRAGAALARRVRSRARLATTVVAKSGPDGVRAFTEGLLLGSYSFGIRSGEPKQENVTAIDLHVAAGRRAEAAGPAAGRGEITADAVCLARDLANTPSAEKTPAWLAARAKSMAARSGLEVQIWEPADLRAGGFGGILAVGQGSAREPRLIRLGYTPSDATGDEPHVVLVGKGITFDSGGLSLKPTDGMVAMKADMAGGAAVIGAMSALHALSIPVRVTGLVAAAENMPSGSAFRPGDVITHYGGTTVEVLNTDAEGRLVLADALAYADVHLDPDVMVDLATLTGAATLALSRRMAALFTADDRLATALEAASAAGGDRIWRMPLIDEYRPALDSPIADIAHVPHERNRKVQGGAITAALFLREFVGERSWAHIDMAGPGKIDGDEHENTKGGTGYGVRLLLRWLEAYPARRR
ncbi:leucyl aminopeptidase [Sporichthya sp.]|uniref:leucyl aminopeptidase n=1 Tax=Sporichthya sp. TaxID=65475 RepID=UPI0017AEDFA6|nr:leucyl aminopeptidase [Sporichthya sp.]MBA3744858.1 leucyl aminopeptidase [Sporichthya sp.]